MNKPDLSDALDKAVRLVGIAAQWQVAIRALPVGAPPTLYQRMVAQAVKADDAARSAVNAVRGTIGVGLLPDPADPPPARPDD